MKESNEDMIPHSTLMSVVGHMSLEAVETLAIRYLAIKVRRLYRLIPCAL